MLKQNLRALYDVKQAPSDTYMRERLDLVEPNDLQICLLDDCVEATATLISTGVLFDAAAVAI